MRKPNPEDRLSNLMSGRVLLLFVLATAMPVFAGPSDSTYPADFWSVPASPGFTLLGIAPNAVERPGTPTDLALSALNSTKNLSILPRNYALEFSPYWLWAGNRVTYDAYAGNGIWSNMLQSASVSFATSSSQSAPTSESLTSAALGLRASPLRGKIDTSFKGYAPKRRMVRKLLDVMSLGLSAIGDSVRDADRTRKRLVETYSRTPRKELQDSIIQRDSIDGTVIEALVRERHAVQLSQLRATVSDLETRRLGFKWDVAGGVAMDFPGSVFENGRFGWGAWTTLGVDRPNWSVIGVARLLKGAGDSTGSTADFGARVVIPPASKLSISAEGVYRRLLQSKTSQWRAALTLSFPLLANKTVSLTVGRDFGGKQTGDLILLLNLLLGFGSERPI
jgi:hypothetical protein